MRFKINQVVRTENGNNLFQYLCTLTGTLIVLSTSMHSAWPTPSLPQLLGNNSYVSISNSEGSWISALMYLGCPLGSVLAFLTVDLLGRKKVILLTAAPLIVSWISVAYANVTIIYIGRLLAGIADGVTYTVIPMYLGEIADPKIRGFIGASSAVSDMIGILLMNILAIFFNIRVTSLISLLIPLLFLATFTWMPESPYFLVMCNQNEAARNNLMLLTGRNNVDKDMNRLLKAVNCSASSKSNILRLLKMKSTRRGLLILIGLRTFQQLTGFASITMYAQILFEKINSVFPSNIMTIIYFVVQFTFTIISSVLVDKVGRKPLLILSIIGCNISLLIQGTYYLVDEQTDLSYLNVIPALSLIMLVVFFSLGMRPVTVLMLGELFPTSVKAFALCLIEGYYGIIAAGTLKFFQIVKDEFGLFIPFYTFCGCCLFCLLFIIRFVPETKGKTLEEIQEHLCGKKTEELEQKKKENI